MTRKLTLNRDEAVRGGESFDANGGLDGILFVPGL